MAGAARAASLRRLHEIVRTVNGDLDLGRTLEAVCQGVVDGLGFEVAVVNLVVPDGDVEVVAVAGPPSASEALFGTRAPLGEWETLLAGCTPVGDVLVGYDHAAHVDTVPTWVPDTPVSDDPEAWHPLDELFAPLRTASAGLLGVISVDVPRDGRRPGGEQLELLEMYAAQASVAIEKAQLHAAQAQLLGTLSALLSEAPVAIVELGVDGLVREWNPEAERVFGWSRAEVVGRPNPTVEDEDHAQRVAELLTSCSVSRQQVRRRRRDGSLVDVEMSSRVLLDASGRPSGCIGVLVDVSDRVALERELRAAAFQDSLTGLANRARLHELLSAAAEEGGCWLLLLDLDGFKAVNDTLGHEVGDALLVEVSRRLAAVCRPVDTVARLGGDEFVVLLRGEEAEAVALARRVVRHLSRPVELAERRLALGCSVGVAPVATDATSALRDADIAMYAAKAAGKGTYRVFAPELAQAALVRADTAAELGRAVARHELSLRWHPVVDARTRGVVGLEALLRWEHPTRGELPPAEFIPLAEETGAIVALGEWVLHEACRQARRWQQGVPRCGRLTVSVNLSPVQLRHPGIVGHVRSALATSGLEPDRLVLELTEDVLLEDLGAAIAVLARLKALGVRLALDDFGAGYSSLRYLRRLPVDIVKIDRGLVVDVHDDDDSRALVEGVLGLVASLGRLPVVEGVETEAQRRVLEELGAPLLQGFLFARPLSTSETTELLHVGWPSSRVPLAFPEQRRQAVRALTV